jgi:speckle-type POZ protein
MTGDGEEAPLSGWCTTASVGNTHFEYTWTITDFSRKKESIKRDDSIQSSTFIVQGNGKKSRWYLTFLPNGAAEENDDNFASESDDDDDEDDDETQQFNDVAIYLYQVSAYEHYVNSLKFRILFVSPSGKKMVVYQHSYGKKYRYHDSRGWGLADIALPREFVTEDALTIVCQMDIPGNDIIRSGYSRKDDAPPMPDTSSQLSQDLAGLLDDDTFADVNIICDNKTIRCHKSILSARSSVFQAMFHHDMKENKNGEVIISDLDFSTVNDMVRYIYSGRVEDIANKAAALISAADKYDLKDLKSLSERSLVESLGVEQVLDILILADLHKATHLREKAVQFLLSHKTDIFAQVDWKKKMKPYPDLLMEVLEASADKTESLAPPKKKRKKC